MQKLNGFKILVVEDDPDLNDIMCDFLGSESALTISAANGAKRVRDTEGPKSRLYSFRYSDAGNGWV